MSVTVKEISEDDFYEKYRPVNNHLDPDAGWDGCLFIRPFKTSR